MAETPSKRLREETQIEDGEETKHRKTYNHIISLSKVEDDEPAEDCLLEGCGLPPIEQGSKRINDSLDSFQYSMTSPENSSVYEQTKYDIQSSEYQYEAKKEHKDQKIKQPKSEDPRKTIQKVPYSLRVFERGSKLMKDSLDSSQYNPNHCNGTSQSRESNQKKRKVVSTWWRVVKKVLKFSRNKV